jgi:hypothetical protein
MNVTYKRSLLTSIIFGILFVFLFVFYLVIGPEEFLSNKINTVISVVVIIVAMGSFGFMLLFTNKKSNVVDERDYFIQKKASSFGLMISMMYVFLLSIVLFIVYRDYGVVNVSWMWFIAYSTFSFGYFVTSLAHVYLYHYEE